MSAAARTLCLNGIQRASTRQKIAIVATQLKRCSDSMTIELCIREIVCLWCVQVFAEKELGACEVEHVACGSGLERIYRFLQSDESCNRPHLEMDKCKARSAPPV